MLKRSEFSLIGGIYNQPPSGGCVLKLNEAIKRAYIGDPAAFGRLRVETALSVVPALKTIQPPSGGCVLKHNIPSAPKLAHSPAAFGRLRVETLEIGK